MREFDWGLVGAVALACILIPALVAVFFFVGHLLGVQWYVTAVSAILLGQFLIQGQLLQAFLEEIQREFEKAARKIKS